MARVRLLRVCLLCLAGGLACGSSVVQPDEEGEDCFMYQPPPESEDWPTRTLELGSYDGESFTAWVDGGGVPAQLGFQGFWMLTPGFSVAREPGDTDGECWFVRVDAGDPERELEPLTGVYPGGLAFAAEGDWMRAGPLFHVIDETLIGVTQRMDVTVYGEGFRASTSVTYTIE